MRINNAAFSVGTTPRYVNFPPGMTINGHTSCKWAGNTWGHGVQGFMLFDDGSAMCTLPGYRSPDNRDHIYNYTDHSVSVLLNSQFMAKDFEYPDGSRFVKKRMRVSYSATGEPGVTDRAINSETCYWYDQELQVILPYPKSHRYFPAPSAIVYPDWEDKSVLPETSARFHELDSDLGLAAKYDTKLMTHILCESAGFGKALLSTSPDYIQQQAGWAFSYNNLRQFLKYLETDQPWCINQAAEKAHLLVDDMRDEPLVVESSYGGRRNMILNREKLRDSIMCLPHLKSEADAGVGIAVWAAGLQDYAEKHGQGLGTVAHYAANAFVWLLSTYIKQSHTHLVRRK